MSCAKEKLNNNIELINNLIASLYLVYDLNVFVVLLGLEFYPLIQKLYL